MCTVEGNCRLEIYIHLLDLTTRKESEQFPTISFYNTHLLYIKKKIITSEPCVIRKLGVTVEVCLALHVLLAQHMIINCLAGKFCICM
jgi:hypothetical protein